MSDSNSDICHCFTRLRRQKLERTRVARRGAAYGLMGLRDEDGGVDAGDLGGGWVGRARPTTLNVSAVGAGFLLGMGRDGEFVEGGVVCEVEEDDVRVAGGGV